MGAQSKRIQMAPTECNNGNFSLTYQSEMQQHHHHYQHQQQQQQHQQQQQQPQHRRQTSASSEGTRLTVMLLTVSFTFLLLTLPVNILLIFTYYWNSSLNMEGLSKEEKILAVKKAARFYLIKAIIDILMYTNHSINFFLYCATGQKFRHQLFNLFRRCTNFKRHSTSNGFRFRRSARRTSGSFIGGISEVTSSSRCGHRASSCVSFDMTDCAVRWDCSYNNGNNREESHPLQDEKTEFAKNNKSVHCNINGSCSCGSLCAATGTAANGGGLGGGGGANGNSGSTNCLPEFQHFHSFREHDHRHHQQKSSTELKPILNSSSATGIRFSSPPSKKREFSFLALPSSKKHKNNKNLNFTMCKFKARNGKNCKNTIRKGSSCCFHADASSSSPPSSSSSPSSNYIGCPVHHSHSQTQRPCKRSFKVYFSSSKRNAHSGSLKEGPAACCQCNGSSYYSTNSCHVSSGAHRQDCCRSATSLYNTKHMEGSCCV